VPTELYLVFLLFAAALVFGWFYLKRAKNRGATTDPNPPSNDPTDPPAA